MISGIRTAEEDLLHAIEHIDYGEYDGALPILSRVVAFAPSNALAYELWVVCHMRLARIDRALELIDAGIVGGIAPVRLNIHKSAALRALGRFDEAAEAARVALAAEPASSDGIRALAAVEFARGSGDAALRIYQEALKRSPDDEDVHFALITLASELERSDFVISARQFLRRFDRDPEVLSMLGQAYVALSDLRRADRAFRDAAHLVPDDVGHHVNVMMVALLAGKENDFEAYLERLDVWNPELAEAAAHQVQLLMSRAAEED